MLKEQQRFLIVRTDRIGDVVLSTPLPKALKEKYHRSFVAVLLRNYTKDIYLNNPFVDEIIIFDEKESLYSLSKQIRKFNFTYSFTLLPNKKINWLLFLSGIKIKIGVGYKFYQFLTNTKSVFRNKYKPLKHESDYCFDQLRKIGIEANEIVTEIYLNESEKNKGQEFKRNVCKNNELLIGINTTSGGSAPNISEEEYKKLIISLKENPNVKIIITDLTPPTILLDIEGVLYPNLNNKLRKSIIIFNSLDLLISSSTGPMHIAAALKIKTLSLFCPLTACSPKLWGPKGNESFIIMPEGKYCDTVCPGDPKICNFSGEGGINSQIIVKNIKQIFSL